MAAMTSAALDPNVKPTGAYYNRWDGFAKDAVAQVEEEDKAEEEAAAKALGLADAPKSEAEAKDRETRAALKQAKALWQKREHEEMDAKEVITTTTDLTVTREMLGTSKRVICLKACSGCMVTLGRELEFDPVTGKFDTPIKVFVEGCSELRVSLKCRLVTSFVEVHRCRDVELRAAVLVHTIQCDLSERLTLLFDEWDAAAPDGPRVYHAGVRDLTIDAGAGRRLVFKGDESEVAVTDAAPRDEQQFVTSTPMVPPETLITERVLRVGDRFITPRELEAERAAGETTAEPTVGVQVDRERLAGNQAFGNREYAQAAVHYTIALDKALGGSAGGAATDDDDDDDTSKNKHIILCNRSACFLKLGELEKALADAAEAVDLAPTYCKAHFRKGVALHAMAKYREALPALGKALEIEPKNKQILESIRFAEMRLARS